MAFDQIAWLRVAEGPERPAEVPGYGANRHGTGFSLNNPGRMTFYVSSQGLVSGFFTIRDIRVDWSDFGEGRGVSIPVYFQDGSVRVQAVQELMDVRGGDFRFRIHDLVPPDIPDIGDTFDITVTGMGTGTYVTGDAFVHLLDGENITDNFSEIRRAWYVWWIRTGRGAPSAEVREFVERLNNLPITNAKLSIQRSESGANDYKDLLPGVPSIVEHPFWCRAGETIGDFAGVAISSDDVLESVGTRSLTLTARYDPRLEDFDNTVRFGTDGLGAPLIWQVNSTSRSGAMIELALIAYAP